jgi:hypothetical protein
MFCAQLHPTDLEARHLAESWSKHSAHSFFQRLSTIHDGTPVVISPEAYDRWLANIEPDPREISAGAHNCSCLCFDFCPGHHLQPSSATSLTLTAQGARTSRA